MWDGAQQLEDKARRSAQDMDDNNRYVKKLTKFYAYFDWHDTEEMYTLKELLLLNSCGELLKACHDKLAYIQFIHTFSHVFKHAAHTKRYGKNNKLYLFQRQVKFNVSRI